MRSTAKLPNFVLSGVPKAGSTALHRYLRQHPQIYMSPVKEPMYFSTADLRLREGRFPLPRTDRVRLREYLAGPQSEPAQFWVTDWEDYVELFGRVRDEIAIGEASVTYFWTPGAAAAMRQKLQGVRLLFVLRDPADRLFSWYLIRRQSPRFRATFREWFTGVLNDGVENGADYGASVDAGRFATHLKRFLEVFPREHVRVHLYDDCRNDLPGVLRDIFEYLGVDPHHPIDVTRRHNETSTPRFPSMHQLRGRVFGDAPLGAWLPEPLRKPLQAVYRRDRRDLSMSPDDRRLVIQHYRDEIERTAELLDRDLSAWLN